MPSYGNNLAYHKFNIRGLRRGVLSQNYWSSAPWWPNLENLKLSYLINTKLWKQHSRSQIEYERAQERNTIIEVLEQYPLVAKFRKYEVGLYNQH